MYQMNAKLKCIRHKCNEMSTKCSALHEMLDCNLTMLARCKSMVYLI